MTATALYLQEPGDTSLINVRDINQGQMGDCFLLAAIGEIALFHPSAITSMIYANPDGTETVTLNLTASGQLPNYGTTSFKSTASRRSGSRSWKRPSRPSAAATVISPTAATP
jgi:hypothetical protein